MILDVGAHVGRVTVRLAKMFPNCAIHSFEPVSSSFDQLTDRVEGLTNVSVHQLAVSDHIGTSKMTHVPSAETNRLVMKVIESDPVEIVKTTTLDVFLDGIGKPNVGLLKVDTEGHDLNVLMGAAESLRLGLIDLIIAECTWNPRGAPHVDFIELVPYLRQAGFDVVASYSENVGRFTRGAGHANVLFAHRAGGVC